MITVNDYIKQILKKKQWTLHKFAIEINKVKKESGINSITTKQNISNYLNGLHDMRPKHLVIWEKALGLKDDTLVNMVELPKSKNGIKELNEIKRKVRK